MTKKLSLALFSIFVLTVLSALLGANGPVNHLQEAARLNNIGAAYMNQQLFEKALKAFEPSAALRRLTRTMPAPATSWDRPMRNSNDFRRRSMPLSTH